MTATNDVDPQTAKVVATIAKVMGPVSTENEALERELAGFWRAEMGDDEFAADVLVQLEMDLKKALEAARNTSERVEVLRQQVVERRVNVLSVHSYALGQRVVDKSIGESEAKAEGEAVLERVQAARKDVEGLADADVVRRLNRELGEIMLEGLYAVERKAMSLRLGRYASSKSPEHTSPPAP